MKFQQTVLVLNGPNLNKLGTREPDVYGNSTLAEINAELASMGEKNKVHVECFQSNHEGEIIDKIHSYSDNADLIGVIINAGAFTHTSIAIKDAMFIFKEVPIIEVHLSNIYKREKERHFSYISNLATAVICGLNFHGYIYALQYLIQVENGFKES